MLARGAGDDRDRDRDREKLIALARMYCEHLTCTAREEEEEEVEEGSLAGLVAGMLSKTRSRLRESVELISALRSSIVINEEGAQAMLQQLTQHSNVRGAVEDRESNATELCGDLVKREDAKLRVHVAQVLIDAWCETGMTETCTTDTCTTDNGCLSLSLVPPPATCMQGENKGAQRRAAALRLKHVLYSQYALETNRFKRLARATVAYENEVSLELISRHQHVLQQRELLSSSLMNSRGVK